MSFINIIKNSIVKPTKNLNTKNIKIGQLILLIICLTFILFIPKVANMIEMKNTFQSDMNLAQKNIPDFTIKDNQLSTNDNQGVIVNGKFISFVFDPTNQKNPKDFIKSGDNNYLMMDLTKNGLYMGINEQLEELVPISPNPMEIAYSNLTNDSLNKQQFFTYFKSMITNPTYKTLIIIISMILILTSLLFNLIILSVSALLYTKLSKLDLKFKEVFNLCTVSSVLPTLIQVVLSFFVSASFLSPLVMVASLFIFFANIRPLSKQNKD